MIKNIAKNQGRYEADIITSGIDKELNLDLYQDKMEELIKEILKPIEAKTEGMSKMDIYDFYNIGDIYRDKYRKE